MKIKASNVYNTQAFNKDTNYLRKKAEKHLKEIKKAILNIDDTVEFTWEKIEEVDWEFCNRGKDIRLYLDIQKTGRKITANNIYKICNSICSRACYF